MLFFFSGDHADCRLGCKGTAGRMGKSEVGRHLMALICHMYKALDHSIKIFLVLKKSQVSLGKPMETGDPRIFRGSMEQ